MSASPERWEVEWCSRYAIDPATGDHDFDADTMEYRNFRTLAAAERFANTLTPQGWGLVQIRRKIKVPVPGYPHLYDWEYVGEVVEIDRPFTNPS